MSNHCKFMFSMRLFIFFVPKHRDQMNCPQDSSDEKAPLLRSFKEYNNRRMRLFNRLPYNDVNYLIL